jgi:hypothetical protein
VQGEPQLDILTGQGIELMHFTATSHQKHRPPARRVARDCGDPALCFNGERPFDFGQRVLGAEPRPVGRAGGVLGVLARCGLRGPTAGHCPQLPRIAQQHVLALQYHRVVIRQSFLLLLGQLVVVGILFRQREVAEQVVNAPTGHATTLAQKTTQSRDPTRGHTMYATSGSFFME